MYSMLDDMQRPFYDDKLALFIQLCCHLILFFNYFLVYIIDATKLLFSTNLGEAYSPS